MLFTSVKNKLTWLTLLNNKVNFVTGNWSCIYLKFFKLIKEWHVYSSSVSIFLIYCQWIVFWFYTFSYKGNKNQVNGNVIILVIVNTSWFSPSSLSNLILTITNVLLMFFNIPHSFITLDNSISTHLKFGKWNNN